MPSSQDSKRYWDSHPIGAERFRAPLGSADFYDEYLSYYDEFYDYKARTFQYEKYRGLKVLEVGCGLGIDSVKFARAGADLVCSDISDTSVKCTRQLLEQLNLKARVLKENVEDLSFPDESFDAVYAYGVLMHVVNESEAVREIYRVLRPGGKALAVLYHWRSWYWLLVNLTGTNIESEEGDPPIVRVHSVRDTRELFSAFSSVEITLDRFPKPTQRRHGFKAAVFNRVFVPAMRLVPKALLRPFGWHIIVRATK